jgi:DHA1 family inner membrane transport protein
MNLRLLSLTFAPFAFGTSAFVFVGIMQPVADGLGVSVPVVGQLQTAFAIACGVGGPILARLLARFDRKRLLIIVMAVLVVMNIASALADDFVTVATIRIIGGLLAALTLPLTSTIAVSMVPDAQRPAAIATVLAGYTLAFLIGMPLGTVLGNAFGWQAAFWFAAAISFVASLAILIGAPDRVAAPTAAAASFGAALKGENLHLMVITLLGFLATFATVSFAGPVITAFTGLEGAAIGGVQIATGIGSLLGLPAGAMLARLPTRKALTILMSLTLLTQSMFTIGMTNDLGPLSIPLLVIVMALGSGALFATSPVIQSRLAESAGPAATIAFALNGSMVYFGQGLGAGLGGSVTSIWSIGWVGLAGSLVACVGLVTIMLLQRRHPAAG